MTKVIVTENQFQGYCSEVRTHSNLSVPQHRKALRQSGSRVNVSEIASYPGNRLFQLKLFQPPWPWPTGENNHLKRVLREDISSKYLSTLKYSTWTSSTAWVCVLDITLTFPVVCFRWEECLNVPKTKTATSTWAASSPTVSQRSCYCRPFWMVPNVLVSKSMSGTTLFVAAPVLSGKVMPRKTANSLRLPLIKL